MSVTNFHQALIAIYRENPCQVLPNALWKSLAWDSQFETDFKVDKDRVTSVHAEGSDHLMLFWNRDRTPFDFQPEHLNSLKFALLHQDFVSALPHGVLTNRESYFRMIHHMEYIPTRDLPAVFRFQSAYPRSESHAIANLIGKCYEDIQPSAKTVRSWIDHPVFDPTLWVWVIDEQHHEPVGLGIADFDDTIHEGSLEWIQVVPEYRGRGLGKHIVGELLNRLKGRAKFTTVSGLLNNSTHPEKLYRSCGFEGDDIWWVLKK